MRSAKKANGRPQTIPTAMTDALCRSSSDGLDEDEILRRLDGKRLKQHGVHEPEDRRIGADAKGDG